MPEIVRIALGQFVILGLVCAAAYGIYRLVRFVLARMPDDFFGKKKEDTWDGVEFLYSIPSSIFGFLFLVYVIVSVVAVLIVEGIGDVFSSDVFAGFWGVFTDGTESLLGIIGCVGIFTATVFGIYQDYPPTRMKLLGVIAVCTALVGIGYRLR